MNAHPLRRHILACNNVHLPGGRIAFHIGPTLIGLVEPPVAQALTFWPQHIHFDTHGITVRPGRHAAALTDIARSLSERGHFRWRGEAFDVRATPDGPALTELDRGAIPVFGMLAQGVHLNGLVRRPDGLHLWVARRAADKKLDPGKLDNLVAGGVPTGLSPLQTLVKEAEEEASLPPDLTLRAEKIADIAYAMAREEGLRRDHLHCYDLYLPEDFRPTPADGEVEAFELWPLPRVFETVRDTDDFKFNVNLVLIDLFLRHGLIDPASPEGQWLRRGIAA